MYFADQNEPNGGPSVKLNVDNCQKWKNEFPIQLGLEGQMKKWV